MDSPIDYRSLAVAALKQMNNHISVEAAVNYSEMAKKTRKQIETEYGADYGSDAFDSEEEKIIDAVLGGGSKEVTGHIKKGFSKLEIKITDYEIISIEKLLFHFETREQHIMALNGQMLAVYPIVFTPSDRLNLFEIFNVKEKTVADIINVIPSINKTYKVVSDPFNLFSIWLLHLANILISDKNVRYRFMLAIAKYLHYRFFTSFIHRVFPYGASEAIMSVVITKLSRKFDLVTLGTWKEVIHQRCHDYISNPPHVNTFIEANNDKGILYAIIDFQTRIRSRIKLIQNLYYKIKEEGEESIGTRASTKEIDGEMHLVQTVSAFDNMTINTFNELTSIASFVDHGLVRKTVNTFNAISVPMFINLLNRVSMLAAQQTKSGTLDKVEQSPEGEIIVGLRKLTATTIQAGFRYAVRRGAPMSDKRIMYIKIKDAYGSSRISDDGINAVRRSISYLVEEHSAVSREATKSSLKLALIMYIIVKSMKYY